MYLCHNAALKPYSSTTFSQPCTIRLLNFVLEFHLSTYPAVQSNPVILCHRQQTLCCRVQAVASGKLCELQRVCSSLDYPRPAIDNIFENQTRVHRVLVQEHEQSRVANHNPAVGSNLSLPARRLPSVGLWVHRVYLLCLPCHLFALPKIRWHLFHLSHAAPPNNCEYITSWVVVCDGKVEKVEIHEVNLMFL